MSTTPLFGMTEWEQDQEQPHVTVNTNLRIVEIMSQLVIKDFVHHPPTGADDGDAYYIDGVGNGDWTGHSHVLALRVGDEWKYVTPFDGLRAFDANARYMVVYDIVDVSPPGWRTL